MISKLLWNSRHAIVHTSSSCLDWLRCFHGISNGHSKLDRTADKNGRFLRKVEPWITKLSSLRPPTGQIGRAICRGSLVSRQMQEDNQLHRKTKNTNRWKANFYSRASIRLVHRTLSSVTKTFLLREKTRTMECASYNVLGRERIVKVPLIISKSHRFHRSCKTRWSTILSDYEQITHINSRLLIDNDIARASQLACTWNSRV